MIKPANNSLCEICVADWDGTLIKGYSILDWMSFLKARRIISGSSLADLDNAFRDYHNGNIAYETLVLISGNVYATAVMNIDTFEIRRLALLFAEQSQEKLQPFFRPLITLLSENGIALVIISGAPQEVIEAYCRNMSIILGIYALTVSSIRNKYTGIISSNYGIKTAKQTAINGLLSRYSNILIGIGNADSDEPLLRAAKFSFFLGPSLNSLNLADTEVVSPDNILDKMRGKLSKEYRHGH